MHWCFRRLCAIGCVSLLAASFAYADASKTTTPQAKSSAHHVVKAKHKKSHRRRGQQKIDPQRATQIQQALIKEHYLSGKASGKWDSATQAAMQKYQADNGWQSKNTPDSRALIKLGLGPDHDHLLNPESAMTSQPAVHTMPTTKSPTNSEPTQPQR